MKWRTLVILGFLALAVIALPGACNTNQAGKVFEAWQVTGVLLIRPLYLLLVHCCRPQRKI